MLKRTKPLQGGVPSTRFGGHRSRSVPLTSLGTPILKPSNEFLASNALVESHHAIVPWRPRPQGGFRRRFGYIDIRVALGTICVIEG
jgi:hypothetical protein